MRFPILAAGRTARPIAAAAALAATLCYAQEPPEPFSIADSIAHGRLSLELRPRYNRIEESNYPKTTDGGTMRTVIGWTTAPYRGWRVRIEGINASHPGPAHFNDDPADFATSPYPLLPDPTYTGMNQAYLDYSGDGLRARLGRQVVRLENQRWVSDNDFRQIPQVFDGVALAYEGLERVRLAASYFDRVRTTSGTSSKLRLTLLDAAWNPTPQHAISAYAVLHDQPQNGAFTGFANNSYRVLGLKAEGSAWRFANGIEVPYLADIARQDAYAGGDSRIDARYWRVGAGFASRNWTIRADRELKGSNAGAYGVQMPLTDFYAYNGWTLNFFFTPPQGLRDDWLTLRWTAGPLTLYGESHRFHSDAGSLDFGREQDLGVTWEIMGGLNARLQHARYDPGAGLAGATIRKTWLTLTYNY
jgi:alginate export protein